ncbi:MAG: hypothetical protein LBN92_02725 [Treponema sp.]|jgi:hypothetical protein|nr:hypothetical protein [Treponema sp.]
MPAPQPRTAAQPPQAPASQPASAQARPVTQPVQPIAPARPPAPTPQPRPAVQPPQAPAQTAVPPPRPPVSAPPANQGYRPAPLLTKGPPPPPRQPKAFTTNLEKAKGSVSDRLKKLSGRSYDVYQDRFHAKSRGAIRKVLGAGRGLFFNLPEEAEDLIFNFLRNHYSDPYMDWEKSPDRKNLLEMGYDLPSLDPVIDECYRTL